MTEPDYIIYSDCGYHLGRNEGAYAYIILRGEQIVGKKAVAFTHETSNRGELMAVIDAVDSCPHGARLEVRSDSQYVVNTLSGEWRHRTNDDLFVRWKKLVARKKLKITLTWVRGHSGDKYNEMCDAMCDELL